MVEIATTQPRQTLFRPTQFLKYFAYVHALTPLVAGSLGKRDSFVVDGDSDFLIFKTAALFDNGGAKVQNVLTPVAESFESAPIFISHYGSGQRPMILRPPRLLARRAIFQLVADDRQVVPADNSIVIAYHGAKIYREPLNVTRRYAQQKEYRYVANFTADDGGTGDIPANATRIFNIRTDGDSDFEVMKLTLTSDGPVTVQIQSDNDNWFLTPLRGELLGGNLTEAVPPGQFFSGEYAFELPAPRFVTGAGYITVTVSDLSGAPNTVQLVVHGTRLYPAGGYPV